MNAFDIRIEEFNYELPDERIAKFPLEKREASKLLIYNDGLISQKVFSEISDELHEGDLIISNNTRVISARLHFAKRTGAVIEIFCLEPVGTSHQDAMIQRGKSVWKCLVGGAKKWKGDEKLECLFSVDNNDVFLTATKITQVAEAFEIEFNWTSKNEMVFSEILFHAGELPLPPYFHRDAEEEDYERYQTMFAKHEGSVAAPTAGLHFTEDVLSKLKSRGVEHKEVTLHVGAGTFKPVSSDTMKEHNMHSEFFSVPIDLLEAILNCEGRIIPVGTTSMRTLESLYWIGVQLLEQPNTMSNFFQIEQWQPYQIERHFSLRESFAALIVQHQKSNLKTITGSTSILIAPSYQFRVCHGIITNFHMPKSTLLLLVAAFIGDDWKRVYEFAMKNDFRFLSYGDSSLLWKKLLND